MSGTIRGLLLLSAAWAFVAMETRAAQPAAEAVPDTDAIARQAKVEAEATIVRTTAALEQEPDRISLYSQRGDAHFFLSHFADAVRDYDRMVEVDPKIDAGHWRRGIAYFYAGRYEDAARQFERYHSFDDVDRENGIWRYLSQTKAFGRDKARQGLLKYQKDDREPFPAVYELFAGRTTPAAILDGIRAADISAAERQKRLFYAHLYIGLNEAVEDRPKAALVHLQQAADNPWGVKSGYGPQYMWQVARLHAELLEAEIK